MSTLSVHLLGRFCVRQHGEIVSGFDSRKVQELFSYLLIHRDRLHPREALAGMLWGDTSTVQSKAYLRKALWQLQSALDPLDNTSIHKSLLVEADWVQINPKAEIWLDSAVLDQAFTLVEGLPGEQIDCTCANTLEEAVELYHGDLLDGWYHDWCLYERERLQNIYLALLDKLMGYCEINHRYDHGLIQGSRILRYDRAREQTHRRLMRLYYLAGDRTASLRQYERCVIALDEELGVTPTDYTNALYRQIKSNQLDNSSPEQYAATSSANGLLRGILDHLNELQEALIEVQSRLHQNIQAVEQILKDQR